MIDHIGFPVSDYERAKAFYLKALAPLGYSLVMEVTQEQQPGDPRAAGFGANGKPDFWIGGEGGLNKPMHVAILASDRSTRSIAQRWQRGFKRSSQHSEIGDCDEHLHSKAKIGTIWTSAIAIAGAAAGGGA